MPPPPDAVVRAELESRRERLRAAMDRHGEAPSLHDLLHEVDAALARVDGGTYGACEVCRDPIEPERLRADPLLRNCMDHLSRRERLSLEQELDLARRVQGAMLPERALSAGPWEVAHHYEPAGAVSGDYCDLVTSKDERGDLLFLLGDVSGKGVAASILMSGLRAIVRSLAESRPSPATLVARANRLFCESLLPSHYATLVCGRASAEGEIEVCNAGHCPPLVASGGEVSEIAATGIPLGLFAGVEYESHRLRLHPGDTLLLYSDGVSETRNTEDEEYGPRRLANFLSGRRSLAPPALLDACRADLGTFHGAADMADDLTLMAVRRLARAR
jgi:sigma-B regulation protein RsbU (phosphoserine phosphatase)